MTQPLSGANEAVNLNSFLYILEIHQTSIKKADLVLDPSRRLRTDKDITPSGR